LRRDYEVRTRPLVSPTPVESLASAGQIVPPCSNRDLGCGQPCTATMKPRSRGLLATRYEVRTRPLVSPTPVESLAAAALAGPSMLNSRIPGTMMTACGRRPFSNMAKWSASERLTKRPPHRPASSRTTQLPRRSVPMKKRDDLDRGRKEGSQDPETLEIRSVPYRHPFKIGCRSLSTL
jgi:hypothetical protein